jgi:hypothetical protein
MTQTDFSYDCTPRYVQLCTLNASRYTGKERDPHDEFAPSCAGTNNRQGLEGFILGCKCLYVWYLRTGWVLIPARGS